MKGWVLAVISLVIYGMSVFGGFVQDDRPMIEFNPYMGERSQLLKAWISPYFYSGSVDGLYRPLTSFSFYFNGFMTGYQAWGFRLVNVLLYAGLSWLVFEALKLFVGKRQAFLLALVFAVFPVHTEAVNNIVGRAEILSLGFFLLSLIFLNKKKWEVSAFWFLLALFSKETAIVGLPVLLYLLSFEKKEKKTGVTLFCLATVLYFVLRLVVLGEGNWVNSATVVENPLKYMGVEERVRNAFALVTFGVGKIVFPLNLSYDYSFNQIPLAKSWLDWRVILGVVMMGLSLGSLLTKLRHNRAWIVGQALFWGPIAITGNFLFPSGTIFGERLWFWPSLGLLIIITSFYRLYPLLATDNSDSPAESDYLDTRREILNSSSKPSISRLRSVAQRTKYSKTVMIKYFGIVVIILFAFRTVVRNVDWLSQKRLFLHDASYVRNSVLVMNNKAAMYLMDRDLGKGKEALDEAEKIYPKYPELMNNVGMYWLWSGDREKAKEKFEECLVVRPEYYLCEGNLELLKEGMETDK